METILAPKLPPDDQFFVGLMARGFWPYRAARMAYGVKGDDAQLAEFAKAKLEHVDIQTGLERERAVLTERGCATRAEKRWKLSHYIRESPDPHLVLKAIGIDNAMTGDEVPSAAVVTQYVARAGDVLELDDERACV